MTPPNPCKRALPHSILVLKAAEFNQNDGRVIERKKDKQAKSERVNKKELKKGLIEKEIQIKLIQIQIKSLLLK